MTPPKIATNTERPTTASPRRPRQVSRRRFRTVRSLTAGIDSGSTAMMGPLACSALTGPPPFAHGPAYRLPATPSHCSAVRSPRLDPRVEVEVEAVGHQVGE